MNSIKLPEATIMNRIRKINSHVIISTRATVTNIIDEIVALPDEQRFSVLRAFCQRCGEMKTSCRCKKVNN